MLKAHSAESVRVLILSEDVEGLPGEHLSAHGLPDGLGFAELIGPQRCAAQHVVGPGQLQCRRAG